MQKFKPLEKVTFHLGEWDSAVIATYLAPHPNESIGSHLVQDADETVHVVADWALKPYVKTGYAVLGIEDGKFVVGDTKDNKMYAMNSFRKHFPNAIDVKDLTTEDY